MLDYLNELVRELTAHAAALDREIYTAKMRGVWPELHIAAVRVAHGRLQSAINDLQACRDALIQHGIDQQREDEED
jgi:hypothetical protein